MKKGLVAKKERADELQQALDNPRRNLLFLLQNEIAKHISARESYRLLRKLYDEQCSRTMEY